ncbi:hypothetical protein HYT95_00005 [Candidatus Peregrinibacteria bacterium]|nr:hypothetical protein [Candidatus Peregrinibacteria bacterium]
MLLIILAILFLSILMKSALLSKAPASDVGDLRYNLLSARLLNSADCLAYEDAYLDAAGNNIVRVRAGIVDINKYSTNEWSVCFGNPNTYAVLYLEDFTDGQNYVSNPTASQVDASYRTDYYFVRIRSGNEFHDGRIKISIKGPD